MGTSCNQTHMLAFFSLGVASSSCLNSKLQNFLATHSYWEFWKLEFMHLRGIHSHGRRPTHVLRGLTTNNTQMHTTDHTQAFFFSCPYNMQIWALRHYIACLLSTCCICWVDKCGKGIQDAPGFSPVPILISRLLTIICLDPLALSIPIFQLNNLNNISHSPNLAIEACYGSHLLRSSTWWNEGGEPSLPWHLPFRTSFLIPEVRLAPIPLIFRKSLET